MDEDEHHRLVLACSLCGALFSVLSPLSFSVLWAVNWRPWRIYRFIFLFMFCYLCFYFSIIWLLVVYLLFFFPSNLKLVTGNAALTLPLLYISVWQPLSFIIC